MSQFKSNLFPPIEPYDHGHMPLDDTHIMYFEQSGNPRGAPVLYIHGGPGAGASPDARRFFDPEFYRIIIYDQRGSGRSMPLGETKNNTTPHLVDDIERLRRHLGIDRWLVFGGSWGSTLGLIYAEYHPDRVTGLILRGIFLCRPFEIDWFLNGIRHFFPEAWDEFTSLIPPAERGDLLAAYEKKLHHPDATIRTAAARNFSKYEGSCSTLLPNPSLVNGFIDDRVATGLSRLEVHYFRNNIFLPDNFILNNVGKIRHIPGVIIQGRYDMVCPPISAIDLKKSWPEADLRIIADAGHSRSEPGISAELMAATQRFKSAAKW